ncbi:MAG: LuxR C-terminal-related transcriptional regulator [Sphaerochaetaceae bacterium]|nr:LuxR C-terminal-related transcriptional regulator [Sphaerochaetaceae bacterium]
MEYIDIKTASEKWNLGKRRINTLIQKDRIQGTIKIGNKWLIPKEAERPLPFTKGNKNNSYRYLFPLYFLYITKEDENILNHDEQELYTAQKQFLAGNTDDASGTLNEILDHSENIYVRIGAMFINFFVCIIRQENDKSIEMFNKLENVLSEDFPHRRDFDYLMLELYRYTKGDIFVLNNYHIDFNYEYGPHLYLKLSVLSSAIELIKAMLPDRGPCNLDYYEISCRAYECHGYDYVAVQMHLYMACTYYLYARHKDGDRHLRNAVEISEKLGCVIYLADFYKYVSDRMDDFLKKSDPDFVEAVHRTSQNILSGFNNFLKFMNKENLYSCFKRSDYKILGLVINNYSNKEIAYKLNVSEKTVERLLNQLYEKTGVNTKKGLKEIFMTKKTLAI